MKFKHFLNFKNSIGRIEISEPFGFDGASYEIKQDEKRYGRDIVFANKDVELTLVRGFFEATLKPQVLPDGTEINHLSHGFDYIKAELESYGWESDVEYELQENDSFFSLGIIDGFTTKIREDEIQLKFIQNTKREITKRLSDTYVNAFSDKDLDGNALLPCQTTNILLKAKPIYQTSTWVGDFQLETYSITPYWIFPSAFLKDFEIKDSYVPADRYFVWEGGTLPIKLYNQRCITAKESLTNIKISLNLKAQLTKLNRAGEDDLGGRLLINMYRGNQEYLDSDPAPFFIQEIATVDVINPLINIEESYVLNIDSLNPGESLVVSYLWRKRKLLDQSTYNVNFIKCDMDITCYETATDSVIKGIRLIDLIRHNAKSVSNMPVYATLFDVGGIHYDNFAFNGHLISQDTSKSFNNKLKDLLEIPMEVNCGYQINENNIEILDYKDFYKNTEIAVLSEIPNHENETEFNKRYFLKQIEYGYKNSTFGKNDNKENTKDDTHTGTQWLVPTKKTDGILKIENDHIRSAFLIEEQRRQAVRSNVVNENDDKIFLLDCTLLENGTRRRFIKYLTYSGDRVISDGTFKWDLLGFSIGDTIIINGLNVLVVNFDGAVMFISGLGAIGVFNFLIDYPITNVSYVNRTNEGFSFINGIKNGDNFSNLRYTIKRNLQNFYPNLATACFYLNGKEVKNTLFKVNDKLETRLTTEAVTVIDKEPIIIDKISSQKILNPKVHRVNCFATFEKVTQLIKDVSTLKGFVRVKLNDNSIIKGYIKDLDYEFATNNLDLVLEEKHEPKFTKIEGSGGYSFVNGTIYENLTFEINNNFVSLYDSENILILEPIFFNKIEINGVYYSDKILFSDALMQIL